MRWATDQLPLIGTHERALASLHSGADALISAAVRTRWSMAPRHADRRLGERSPLEFAVTRHEAKFSVVELEIPDPFARVVVMV
jgi:hypothetical protein